ncbi:MAG: polysaccharide biosynthesis/export family protein [Bacteroidota bacterium]|nr:polysaccharide biosynthesis/export family protein [Bacteroidota bacterium]
MDFKKANFPLILFLSILFMSSCANVKDIAYFQKVDNKVVPLKNQRNSSGLYDAHIKAKDILSITVVSTEPETSKIYNLVVPQISDDANQNSLLSQPTLQSYLVDNDGNIDFPVFGKIKVAGLTRKEVELLLLEKLSTAFSKEIPIVTIRIVNYSVNILGEVQRPGKFTTTNDRLTIFEALALAGDLTIYGRRDNVKVLRENATGYKEYITLNLNDKNIIYSPGYYLEQNDVVYVEPNKSRSRSSNYGAAETFGISSLSVLLTLTSLIFTVFKIKI